MKKKTRAYAKKLTPQTAIDLMIKHDLTFIEIAGFKAGRNASGFMPAAANRNDKQLERVITALEDDALEDDKDLLFYSCGGAPR